MATVSRSTSFTHVHHNMPPAPTPRSVRRNLLYDFNEIANQEQNDKEILQQLHYELVLIRAKRINIKAWRGEIGC